MKWHGLLKQNSNFLTAVFHKLHLVHSRILCLVYFPKDFFEKFRTIIFLNTSKRQLWVPAYMKQDMNLNVCIKTGNIMIFISSRKNSIHIQFIKNKLIYFNPSSFISRSVAAFISGFISKYSCVCKRKVISKLNFFNTSRFSLQRRIQIRSNICHGDFLQK